MIPVVLCKVSQPSVQKRKSYDENFVTAKSARINYGATLSKPIVQFPITQRKTATRKPAKLLCRMHLFDDRFEVLWQSRYHAWPRLQEGARLILKVFYELCSYQISTLYADSCSNVTLYKFILRLIRSTYGGHKSDPGP